MKIKKLNFIIHESSQIVRKMKHFKLFFVISLISFSSSRGFTGFLHCFFSGARVPFPFPFRPAFLLPALDISVTFLLFTRSLGRFCSASFTKSEMSSRSSSSHVNQGNSLKVTYNFSFINIELTSSDVVTFATRSILPRALQWFRK